MSFVIDVYARYTPAEPYQRCYAMLEEIPMAG